MENIFIVMKDENQKCQSKFKIDFGSMQLLNPQGPFTFTLEFIAQNPILKFSEYMSVYAYVDGCVCV